MEGGAVGHNFERAHDPRWRMRIQVRINIIVFVKIMDYSSVFHVLIDVSLNMKLKYNEALS
jgi:hypothetical protein